MHPLASLASLLPLPHAPHAAHAPHAPLGTLGLVLAVVVAAGCPGRDGVIDPPLGEGEGEAGEGEGEAGEGEGEAGEGEGEGTNIDTIFVHPADLFCAGACQVEEGDTILLAADALDANGERIDGVTFTWRIAPADAALASVDQTGLVTGIERGAVEVQAEAEGVVGSVSIAVVGPRPVRVEVDPTELDLADGQSATVDVTVFGEDDVLLEDSPVVFVSGDEGVATVDETSGEITGVGPGGTVVIASATDGFFVLAAITVRVTSSDPVPGALALAELSGGSHHTCGVTPTGDGVCFGDNQFGQLGNGVQTAPGTPTATAVVVANVPDLVTISAGQYASCALDVEGAAWCWGLNDSGQLGTTVIDPGNGEVSLGSPFPVEVDGDHVFASISVGGSHTCGIDDAGAAWCWGANFGGQVGSGSLDATAPAPALVTGGHTWSHVVTGLFATCGLDDAGRAFCWGDPSQGQIGNGNDNKGQPVRTPQLVSVDETFVDIAMTGTHACAVTGDGRAFCWGDNTFGQLGDGNESTTSAVPVAVDTPLRFTAIAVAAHNSCAVTLADGAQAAGEVVCWGNNDFAYLGDGTLTSRLAPTPIAADDGLVFVDVDGGSNHTCARTDAGEAWCWGSGATGELGSARVVELGAFPVRVAQPGG